MVAVGFSPRNTRRAALSRVATIESFMNVVPSSRRSATRSLAAVNPWAEARGYRHVFALRTESSDANANSKPRRGAIFVGQHPKVSPSSVGATYSMPLLRSFRHCFVPGYKYGAPTELGRTRIAARLVLTLSCLLGLWTLGLGTSVSAAQLTAAQTEFFETKVRPVLVENCYKCHSAGAEKIKGGLLLDTRDGVLKGGDTGPVVVPGKPDDSLLVKAIRYTDKDLQMPPADKKLPDNLIADLVQWIRMGAPDPRTEATSAKAMYAADMEKGKKHWAYKPVVKAAVPQPDDPQKWIQNPVDNFILAGLQS